MDGIFEKFSVYDFFNLIISGGTFIGGLHLIGFAPLTFLVNDIKIPDNEIVILAVILLICYIIGFELQGLISWIEENILKIQSTMTGTFLFDNSGVIQNIEKLKIYRMKATELFESKNIKVKKNEFTEEQCEYFFAYCIYFVQVQGQSKKTEKMRGLKGLASLWMVCFALLFFIGLVRSIFLLITGTDFQEMIVPFFSTIAFLILSITSYCRMKTNIKYWIRMLLGVYEVCSDLSDAINYRKTR